MKVKLTRKLKKKGADFYVFYWYVNEKKIQIYDEYLNLNRLLDALGVEQEITVEEIKSFWEKALKKKVDSVGDINFYALCYTKKDKEEIKKKTRKFLIIFKIFIRKLEEILKEKRKVDEWVKEKMNFTIFSD